MSLEVKFINPQEHLTADFFSKDNFFGSALWTTAHGKACQSFGVFNGQELLAIFHLYHYTRLGKHFLINPPMAPHCGFKMRHFGEKLFTIQSERKRVISAMAAYLKREYKGAYFDFCMPPEVVDVQPFQWKNFHTLPKYTYLLDLNLDEAALLKGMSTERRNNVKNALKGGYEVKQNTDPDVVMELVTSTLLKAGTSFNPKPLRNLLDQHADAVFSVLVYKDDRPLATVVCAHDVKTAYYLAGGHDATADDSLAGTLALWHAITEAQMWGCNTFDFLGSSIIPIERFFRGFGGSLTPYYRIQTDPGIVGWLQKQRLKYKAKK